MSVITITAWTVRLGFPAVLLLHGELWSVLLGTLWVIGELVHLVAKETP